MKILVGLDKKNSSLEWSMTVVVFSDDFKILYISLLAFFCVILIIVMFIVGFLLFFFVVDCFLMSRRINVQKFFRW